MFAHRCAKQFSAIEIYWFKKIFQGLADQESAIAYWKEDSLLRYLEIPDIESGRVGSLIFKSASYLAGFPFVSTLSPAPLTAENLIKVLALYDGRYKGLLKEDYDVLRLLFASFATVENLMPNEAQNGQSDSEEQSNDKGLGDDDKDDEQGNQSNGASIEEYTGRDGSDYRDYEDYQDLQRLNCHTLSEHDEDLIVYSLKDIESWDEIDVVKKLDGVQTERCFILASDLAALFGFLLAVADVKSFQKLSWFSQRMTREEMAMFTRSAWNLIRCIDPNVKETTKIYYPAFATAVRANSPRIFQPLGALFDQLLFQHGGRPSAETMGTTELEKSVYSTSSAASNATTAMSTTTTTTRTSTTADEHHIILTNAMKAQLSQILEPEKLFGSKSLLRLYSAAKDGFSMRAFQTKVFKWNAPTILVVQGRIVGETTHTARLRNFNDLFPPMKAHHRRFKGATYGAYIETGWKISGKECFADSSSVLFQLSPIHDQYRATHTGITNYAYFSKEGGIGFGSPPPSTGRHFQSHIGPVSLTLDESLEFGVFRHMGSGGSFSKSIVLDQEFEDRFVIDELEVWGCCNAHHFEEQRKKWE